MRQTAPASCSRPPNHNRPRFYTAWVRRVGFVMSAVRPVHPKKQTFPDRSALRIVPNAGIGSDPMADVRDVESGKVQATRELFGADQPLNDGGSLRLALRPSLWSASGVRLLRCRAEMTANIIKRDWRRLGKRWQWDRGLKYLANFYQRLFEIAVPLKNQGRRKAILLPFAKRAANGRIHCQ